MKVAVLPPSSTVALNWRTPSIVFTPQKRSAILNYIANYIIQKRTR
ncbi:hypothetical protein KCP75_11650 [Salmonella enterica subsp. enterica]|nr:hypothetical protein KCP75_11650 [Salmonella enterica subsp. enterica]